MNNLLSSRSAISCAIFFFFALGGCKKDAGKTTSTQTTTTTESYVTAITSTGCNYTGDLISFSWQFSGSSISISSLHYDFGDGTGSDDESIAVQHAYSAAGTYTVTLTVNGHTVTKNITITPYGITSPYTAHVGGQRHWVGSGGGAINEINAFSTTPLIVDTMLTIQIMDPGIIKLPFYSNGLTLNLTSVDTVNKLLRFAPCPASAAANYELAMTLLYYYVADSLVYSNSWTPSVGHEYEYFSLHSVK